MTDEKKDKPTKAQKDTKAKKALFADAMQAALAEAPAKPVEVKEPDVPRYIELRDNWQASLTKAEETGMDLLEKRKEGEPFSDEFRQVANNVNRLTSLVAWANGRIARQKAYEEYQKTVAEDTRLSDALEAAKVWPTLEVGPRKKARGKGTGKGRGGLPIGAGMDAIKVHLANYTAENPVKPSTMWHKIEGIINVSSVAANLDQLVKDNKAVSTFDADGHKAYYPVK